MRESNKEQRDRENRLLAVATAEPSPLIEDIAGNAIISLQSDEGLYLMVSYVLDILEAQAKINYELLEHIKTVAGNRIDLTPATISEIIRTGFDQLAKEADERTRKLSKSVYG